MTRVRITKEVRFEMAHALMGYKGPCKFIHGHSYVLSVSVMGVPNPGHGDPQSGMIMDFSSLKQIMETEIIQHFDHALLIWEGSPLKDLSLPGNEFGNVMFTSYQPTCENILLDMVERIARLLPLTVKLQTVILHETATSRSEWHAEDNAGTS